MPLWFWPFVSWSFFGRVIALLWSSNDRAIYNGVLDHSTRTCSIDHGFILSPPHDHTIRSWCFGIIKPNEFPYVYMFHNVRSLRDNSVPFQY